MIFHFGTLVVPVYTQVVPLSIGYHTDVLTPSAMFIHTFMHMSIKQVIMFIALTTMQTMVCFLNTMC